MGAMDLNTYLKAAPRGTAAAIAKAVGVQPVMVAQWSKRIKAVPPERCVAIEAATRGQVSRQDLRPDDWQAIWPELRPAAMTAKRKTKRAA